MIKEERVENEKVVTQQRHQQSGASGSDRRTEFKLRNKDYVWLEQSGASGPGCAGLGHGSGVVVDPTPTELDVVPSSLLHHSTSGEAPPQSPPHVPFNFGCGVPLMRVVADAGYAPGVCVCLGLSFWSKVCVYLSPLAGFRTCLALRAAVAGFSHSSVFLRHIF